MHLLWAKPPELVFHSWRMNSLSLCCCHDPLQTQKFCDVNSPSLISAASVCWQSILIIIYSQRYVYISIYSVMDWYSDVHDCVKYSSDGILIWQWWYECLVNDVTVFMNLQKVYKGMHIQYSVKSVNSVMFCTSEYVQEWVNCVGSMCKNSDTWTVVYICVYKCRSVVCIVM